MKSLSLLAITIAVAFVPAPAWAGCYDRDNPPSPERMAAAERWMFGGTDGERYYLQQIRWLDEQGAPVVLTWSLVPDGVFIPRVDPAADPADVGASSVLFARMNALFGGQQQQWLDLIQDVFDRWEELGGVRFVRVQAGANPWDDGAAWGSGRSATRGDIRIGMRPTTPGYFAWARGPRDGDVFLGSQYYWANPQDNFLFLRNTLAHEVGHSLGLRHVCPGNETKLMEPWGLAILDGPQHDDIRGLHREHGDMAEPNNDYLRHADLGSIALGGTLTVGEVPGAAIANGAIASLDADAEEDWYRITITEPLFITATLTPVGLAYRSDPEASGACPTGTNPIDSLLIADLAMEIRTGNGTFYTQASTQPAGNVETISNLILPTTGHYLIRVYEVNSPAQTQLYRLTLAAGGTPCPSNIAWGLAANTGPSPRLGHALAHDSLRDQVLLFGGQVLSSPVNDTWLWNGGVWTAASPSSVPPARLDHAMAYDSARNRIVLFGGSDYATWYADTWEWDGASWTLITTAGPSPSPRTDHAMVYDSARGRVVLFGGWGIGGYQGDTWDWDGITWRRLATTGPSPRSAHALAYDSARDRVVLFGGFSFPTSHGDTWEWDGTRWNPRRTLTSPGDRLAHAMAYDRRRGTVVLFGGLGPGGLQPGDTWEWNGGAWTLRTTSGPSPRFAHAMTYDATHDRILLFGGHVASQGDSNELWAWGLDNDDCLGARQVFDGLNAIDNLCAADSPSGCANIADVWFRYTATGTGTTTVETCGLTPLHSTDTILGVYTGSCASLAEIGCVYGNCGPQGRQSRISFSTTAAGDYYIRLGGDEWTGQFQITPPSVSVPPHDDCANAQVISPASLPLLLDTNSATTDGPPACPVNQDVWYLYTATCTGTVQVTVSGVGFAAAVAVYDGSTGCPPTNQVACDISGAGSVTFQAVANTTYRIRVGGVGAGNGRASLDLTCMPANDDCAGAAVAYDGLNAFSNVGVTDGSPDCANRADVWFEYTATADGLTVVETCNLTVLDTVLAAYEYDCVNLTRLACNDNACQTQSRISFTTIAGQTFLIRLGSASGAQGSGQFRVTAPAIVVPANDDCVNAVPLAPFASNPFDTTNAATSGPAGCSVNQDVWFTYTPAQDAELTVTATSATVTPALAAYEGPCGALTLVECNDSGSGTLIFPALANTTYLIRVGRVGMAFGAGTLDFYEVPTGSFLPTCPPTAHKRSNILKTYDVTGNPNSVGWAWHLQSTNPASLFQNAQDLSVPGVAASGTTLHLAQRFADSINDYALAQGCSSAELSARAINTGLFGGKVLLSIRAGHSSDFELYVGQDSPNPPQWCRVKRTLVAGSGVCQFNPTIEELDEQGLVGTDCNTNGLDDYIDIQSGDSADCNYDHVPDECELTRHDCCETGHGSGCSDPDIQACVCGLDEWCCSSEWDSLCVEAVELQQCGSCTEPGLGDCNGNAIPDDCDIAPHNCCNFGHGPGCSDPGIEACVCESDPYCCEGDWDFNCADQVIGLGCGSCTSPDLDCNANAIPDECEFVDCNGNGYLDDCDILAGTSQDCSNNGIPDECEADCDGNGVADACEPDCNGNGIADPCDIVGGTSVDFDFNGIPDECQPLEACCLPGYDCMDTDPGSCFAQGGTPQGPGTPCAASPCVPAATMESAVSRKSNPNPSTGGFCDTNLVPPRKSEPHQGGITEVRIGFNVPPGAPSGSGVIIEQATCAAPPFVPYSGASTFSAGVAGTELVMNFTPGLENARTYRLLLGPPVTSTAGQVVEVRGLFGDATGNGRVDAADRSAVVGAWTGSGFSCPSDVTGNGVTDAADRSAIVGAWTGSQNCAP